jgi:beta-glucosidase
METQEQFPSFPKGFIFGAATASYQIEGAVREDGRGPSVWDEFSHKPGKIKGGDTGDTTCDHYHRKEEDVRIMEDLGLDAYRFSIAWPRIFPEGTGTVNGKGLDFYDRLVDRLKESGIEPFVTLFHWDLPAALQQRFGGFADRSCIDAYVDYADTVTARLGDRVKHWISFNEPWVYAVLGHFFGNHAPGKRNLWTMMKVAHHQLLAHGKALEVIRANSAGAKAGITLNLMPLYPRSGSGKDLQATGLADQFINRLFLDPLFRGSWPEELWKSLGPFRPRILPGDMETISAPIDFLGINNYTREFAYHKCRPFFPFHTTGMDIPEAEFVRNGVQHTSMGWEVYPKGIFEVLCRIRDEYGNPLTFITENGAAFTDKLKEGRVEDDKRIDFYRGYTAAVADAAARGCNVKGYFAWSLMDNFEWAEGFSKRFGLVYVDYLTGERTIKKSGRWYAELIRSSR